MTHYPSALCGLMSLAQFVWLVTRVEVLVAGHPLPLWPNAVVCVMLGGLSLWLWRLASTATR
jgi:hypothetical protein